MRKTWLKMPQARRAACVLSVLACALAGFGSVGAPRMPVRGLCAHRGDAAAFPENTVPAIEAAARKGAAMVEIDVKRCKTGEFVLMHDATVDRTTTGTGKVIDLTFDELRALDAGVKKDARFAGVKIPTFDEAIDCLPKEGIWINVHCKGVDTVKAVARKLKEKGRLHQAFIAGRERVVHAARAVVPEIHASMFMSNPAGRGNPWTDDGIRAYVEYAEREKSDYLQLGGALIDAPAYRDFRARGGKVIYCFGNDEETIKRIVDLGFEFALTDNLDAALPYFPTVFADSPRRTLRADVFVAGAGPAGVVAAIAAARNGAKVTLAESFGFPGGMATAGLVGPISKFNFAGRRVVGGIPWEFVERLAAAGGAITDLPKGNVPFEAEVYRRVAREMLEEAGVTCLWQTQVCGEPELAADGSIAAVTLSTGGFLTRMEAKRFIDCTASGAIVGYHGFGAFRSEKGAAQPLSLCFILGGVDTDKVRVLVRNDNERSANPTLRAALNEAMAAGRIKSFGGPWAVWGSTIRPGFVSVNATRAEAADVTDPVQIAAATERMRREIPAIVDVMRQADPAFRNAWLAQTATTSGFRECREIKALHRVTATEFASGVDVPDAIALAAHPMDRHLAGSSGQNLTFLERPGVIPLSSLVSAECPNLLAAGGLVAAEPAAFASMRVQAQCMAMGQAAGTLAAFMPGKDVRQLDFVAVRRLCESQGAITRYNKGE